MFPYYVKSNRIVFGLFYKCWRCKSSKILWYFFIVLKKRFWDDYIQRWWIVNPTLGWNFVLALTHTNFLMMTMLMANIIVIIVIIVIIFIIMWIVNITHSYYFQIINSHQLSHDDNVDGCCHYQEKEEDDDYFSEGNIVLNFLHGNYFEYFVHCFCGCFLILKINVSSKFLQHSNKWRLQIKKLFFCNFL